MENLGKERPTRHRRIHLQLKLHAASIVQHDAERAGRQQEAHHDSQQQHAASAANHEVPHDDDEREPDQEEGHELRRVLIMREEDKLGAGTHEAENDDRQQEAANRRQGIAGRVHRHGVKVLEGRLDQTALVAEFLEMGFHGRASG